MEKRSCCDGHRIATSLRCCRVPHDAEHVFERTICPLGCSLLRHGSTELFFLDRSLALAASFSACALSATTSGHGLNSR